MAAALNGQETIRQRVRELPPDGDISVTTRPMYPSMDAPRLLPLSDVVIEGTITSGESSLTDDERSIETSYEVNIDKVLMSAVPTRSSADRLALFSWRTAASGHQSWTRAFGGSTTV
jgi:hypothetical protein